VFLKAGRLTSNVGTISMMKKIRPDKMRKICRNPINLYSLGS